MVIYIIPFDFNMLVSALVFEGEGGAGGGLKH